MTVFVCPCGISILENMNNASPPWTNDAATVHEQLKNQLPGQWQQANGEQCAEEVASHWRNWAERAGWLALSPQGLQPHNGHHISAERESLGCENPSYNPDDDRVVLLCSDTPLGVLAAHLNAACLAKSIGFFADPPQQVNQDPQVREDGLHQDGTATIIRIAGLTPGNLDHFDQAAAGLARALSWAHHLAHEQEAGLVLHVAGGFKSTIPILTGIAGLLEDPSPKVWCKHELGSVAVKLPVPRLNRDDLRAAFEDVAKGAEPPDLYKGYCFDWRDNGWVRNDLGFALSATVDRQQVER